MVLQITIALASAGAHVLVYFCGTVGAIGRGDGDEKEGSVAVFGAVLGWGDLSEVWEGALFGRFWGSALARHCPFCLWSYIKLAGRAQLQTPCHHEHKLLR